MNSREGGLPAPVFFGLLEGMSFLCLFFSPLVGHQIWLAIALLRVVVLGVVILPGRAAEFGGDVGPVARFLRQGALYQVPFWVSALLFPLQAGQAGHAGVALLIQCVLLTLLPLVGRWAKAVGAESLVYLLTLGWVAIFRAPGLWLAGVLVVFLATCRGGWSKRAWGWQLTARQALAVGLAWLAVFALPPLSLPPLLRSGSATLLFWLLLLYLGAMISILQNEAAVNDEVEAALPARCSAQAWMMGRRSVAIGLGWAVLPALVVSRPEEVVACVIFLSSWWRALEIAARGWFSAEGVVWWAAAEMTLIWWAVQGGLAASAGALGVSCLWAAWVRLRRPARPPCTGSTPREGLADLEGLLGSVLRQSAPHDFAAGVLKDTGSVELEKDLASAAPAGFRQRLLDRLRRADEESD